MAKIDLKFIDSEEQDRYISVINFKEDLCDEILITVKSYHSVSSIYLDKSTAIKFAKTLRTEINKITKEERGGQDGKG